MYKKVEYAIPLTEDAQLRHIHTHWRNEVISFIVQLEVRWKNSWCPVVRYDTAHGFAHKDTISPDGRKEKVPLPNINFKEALTFSDRDLKANWRIYREKFLKEVKNE